MDLLLSDGIKDKVVKQLHLCYLLLLIQIAVCKTL